MKKIIRFESQGYNVQLQAYEKKLELEGVIARELKARIGIDFKAQDLFPNPELKLFKLIEKRFKNENPMDLSGFKLAELKEIRLSNLLNNEIFDYGKRLHITKPDKKDFSTYAETDSELEKLEACQSFIKAYKTFVPGLVTGNQLKQLFFATNQAITRGENNTLIPNINYVKDAVSTRT